MSGVDSADAGLRSLFRANLPTAQWTTIETGSVAGGVPDAEYCFAQGRQGWVEFKAVRRGWAVRFKPEQVAWHHRRARLGGVSWLAVRRLVDGDHLYLYRGAVVELVAAQGCKCADWTLKVTGGPAGWNWDSVRQLLEGER